MNNLRLILYTLLFICTMFLNNKLYAEDSSSLLQVSRVSINLKNTSLKQIFNSIEQQTDLVFIYNNNDVDIDRKVTVNVESESVENLLNRVLEGTDVAYTVDDKYILIKKMTNEEISTTSSVVSSNTSQNEKISGKIIDEKNNPVSGATIMVKGSTVGVLSQDNGTFSIPANSSDVLEIILLGYANQSIEINGRSFIEVQLTEEIQGLDEVIVVGFAKQKKVNLTGAVSSVRMDDLAGVRPIATTGTLLQGAIPGLQVTSGSGEPGGGLTMNVRGTASIGKNSSTSPLILVDNVPLNGPLNLINPDDIESVTVLKDGGSAAIYGARGAFGVVLITTKGGSKEQKVKLSYTGNIAFSKPTGLPKKASSLQTVQAFKDAGYISHRGRDIDQWLTYLNDYEKNPASYPLGQVKGDDGMLYLLRQYDQIKDFMSETGFQQMHNASLSGGSANSSYRISLGYTNSDGVMVTKKDNYEKYNIRGFINSSISKWLTGQLDLSYYKSEKGMPSNANYNNAVVLPSYTPIGTVNVNEETLDIGTPGNLAKLSGSNIEKYNDTRITGRLIATPIKDLEVTGEYTFDYLHQSNVNYTKRFKFASPYDFNPDYSVTNSTYSNQKQESNSSTFNLFASYKKSISKHNLLGLIGYNVESFHRDYVKAEVTDMINEELPSISQSVGEQKAFDEFNEYSLMGFFGRINYDYKGKYLLELNGRYDGSSKFPKKHRWGFFPSVSGGWRITEESFMSSLKPTITELKLRASYATIGNQNIVNYGYIPGMGGYKPTWLHDNEQVRSLYSPGLVSNNFTWETVETYNIGIDLSLFRNRLNATFDLYRRNTKDMLIGGIELPSVVGASAPLQNAADLKSEGFELDIKWNDRIGDFNYRIAFNLYDYKGTITKYKINKAGLIFNSDGTNQYFERYKMNTIWGYQTERFYTDNDFDASGKLLPGIARAEGINPNPGDVLYADIDGSEMIEDFGRATNGDPKDIKSIGNSSLRMQFGISGGVSWKNIDFSFYIEGVGKRDIWLSNDLVFPLYYEHGGIFSNELNYWTPSNVNSEFPRIYQTGTTDPHYSANIRRQTKYMKNGAYIRVRNLTLSYSLPKPIVEKLSISRARIFTSIENPFMFHHLPKGLDPTVSSKSRGLGYPVMRMYSFGISLDF